MQQPVMPLPASAKAWDGAQSFKILSATMLGAVDQFGISKPGIYRTPIEVFKCASLSLQPLALGYLVVSSFDSHEVFTPGLGSDSALGCVWPCQ